MQKQLQKKRFKKKSARVGRFNPALTFGDYTVLEHQAYPTLSDQ